jgi:hypothetical protein
MITKEDEYLNSKGYSFGVLRNKNNVDHRDYFYRMIEINPYAFEDVPNLDDWVLGVEETAKLGQVMIVNTAIEIDKVEERMYGLYLPSFPSMYQVQELKKHMNEFESFHIGIDVQGIDRVSFLKILQSKNYDSRLFLKKYLSFHEERLSSMDKIHVKQKVMV